MEQYRIMRIDIEFKKTRNMQRTFHESICFPSTPGYLIGAFNGMKGEAGTESFVHAIFPIPRKESDVSGNTRLTTSINHTLQHN